MNHSSRGQRDREAPGPQSEIATVRSLAMDEAKRSVDLKTSAHSISPEQLLTNGPGVYLLIILFKEKGKIMRLNVYDAINKTRSEN